MYAELKKIDIFLYTHININILITYLMGFYLYSNKMFFEKKKNNSFKKITLANFLTCFYGIINTKSSL